MGLVDAKGNSIAKKKGEEGPKPFYPSVNKWNKYQGEEPGGKQFIRLGAPFPYLNHEHHTREPAKIVKGIDGKIITKSRNIQSTAFHPGHYSSTIGHTINPFPKYIDQGYGQLQKNEFV